MPRRLVVAALVLLAASPSLAEPNLPAALREGANHHIGDQSFVATFGRRPDARDPEQLRMRTHLEHMRTLLASRPATKPELQEKRTQLLGYLADYIAKDATPKNMHVPWRTPVFIDDEGTICAVGYLIEQSVGRALPEKIAKSYRYDFIDDIAGAMPEVRSWVEASGMTLEEIASIQPAYTEPRVNTWRSWDLVKHAPEDGAYEKHGWHGTFHKRQMEGTWTVTDDEGHTLGHGEMKHGAGTWVSFYADGSMMAMGPMVANRVNGPWKLFHHSGKLAAEGSFEHGTRVGRWRFYYDTADKTPIAIGAFANDGSVTGHWKHFDNAGKLLATSWNVTPEQWNDTDWAVDGGEGSLIDVIPGADGVHHQSHQGSVHSVAQRLETFSLGADRVYVHQGYEHETVYDADGFKLDHTDAGWVASDCGWGAKRKQIAHQGDLSRLHGLLYKEAEHRSGGRDGGEDTGPVCKPAVALDRARGQRIDALLATRDRVRALSPAFVRDEILGEEADNGGEDEDTYRRERRQRATDLTRVLAGSMTQYIEWPHIDGRFVDLWGTVAGRFSWDWANGDPQRDD